MMGDATYRLTCMDQQSLLVTKDHVMEAAKARVLCHRQLSSAGEAVTRHLHVNHI
jgi:hypothetical protein